MRFSWYFLICSATREITLIYQFINNHASFHLRWRENLFNHQNIMNMIVGLAQIIYKLCKGNSISVNPIFKLLLNWFKELFAYGLLQLEPIIAAVDYFMIPHHNWLFYFFAAQTQRKKCFPLKISWVNVTKSTGNCGFDHIYWRNL